MDVISLDLGCNMDHDDANEVVSLNGSVVVVTS